MRECGSRGDFRSLADQVYGRTGDRRDGPVKIVKPANQNPSVNQTDNGEGKK